MGEPAAGETVLTGTGAEGVRASFASQPLKAIKRHALPATPMNGMSQRVGRTRLAARNFLVDRNMMWRGTPERIKGGG